MNIRYAIPASLVALMLGFSGAALTSPAAAAQRIDAQTCNAQINEGSLTEELSDDDNDALMAQQQMCAAIAKPAVRSHGAEITLAKPLPAKLLRELKPYIAS